MGLIRLLFLIHDAAGLDMKHYLQENPPTAMDDYLTTWTKEPDSWQASPIYFLDKATPLLIFYVGDKPTLQLK
jgi:hypothetical protein